MWLIFQPPSPELDLMVWWNLADKNLVHSCVVWLSCCFHGPVKHGPCWTSSKRLMTRSDPKQWSGIWCTRAGQSLCRCLQAWLKLWEPSWAAELAICSRIQTPMAWHTLSSSYYVTLWTSLPLLCLLVDLIFLRTVCVSQLVSNWVCSSEWPWTSDVPGVQVCITNPSFIYSTLGVGPGSHAC